MPKKRTNEEEVLNQRIETTRREIRDVEEDVNELRTTLQARLRQACNPLSQKMEVTESVVKGHHEQIRRLRELARLFELEWVSLKAELRRSEANMATSISKVGAVADSNAKSTEELTRSMGELTRRMGELEESVSRMTASQAVYSSPPATPLLQPRMQPTPALTEMRLHKRMKLTDYPLDESCGYYIDELDSLGVLPNSAVRRRKVVKFFEAWRQLPESVNYIRRTMKRGRPCYGLTFTGVDSFVAAINRVCP